LKSLDYSKANEMLTNVLNLSFRTGRVKDVQIFEKCHEEYSNSNIEYLIHLYFMFEKEKTFKFFRNKHPYLTTCDQI
jgi:hypothetical protein